MKQSPLAHRMRPETIEEVIGQTHLLGVGKPLFEMIEKKQLVSMILYGKTGIGKTSIANAIAGSIGMRFKKLNATVNNKKDLEIVAEEAKMFKQSIVLCVDEIHRFSKTQIEFLLPHIESGLLILIGLTSENPYHHINPAIRSRCLIFELKSLVEEEIVAGLKKAIEDKERGLGQYQMKISDKVLSMIANSSGGDMRAALNKLEISFLVTSKEGEQYVITEDILKNAVQKNNIHIDKDGDSHYDTLSAFHKSLRGGDVDAACLMLAILIEAGDIIGISRRILATAYEDVGLANPEIAVRALTAVQTAERLGFPEGRIPLANIVIDICLSPKSNRAYMAVDEALAYVRKGHQIKIPLHLQDSSYQSAKELGRGIGYKYPHDYQIGKFGGWVAQQYLPDDLLEREFYQPLEVGYEERLKGLYEKLKGEQRKALKSKN